MLKRNLLANYAGQAWVLAMGIVFVPVYINYLGIEAYGLVGVYTLLYTCLSLIDGGITQTLGREVARFTAGAYDAASMRDFLRTIEVVATAAGAVVVLLIALGADWLAGSWLKPEEMPVAVVAQAFSLMGVVIALRLLEGVYRSSLLGLQRQVLFNAINCVAATVRGAGAIGVLIWVAPTITAFFAWQVVVSLGTVCALGAATYLCLPTAERASRFSLSALNAVRGYAGGVTGITFLSVLLTQVDKIVLSKVLTLSEYGYYTLAGVAANALYVMVGPVAQAVFPRMCQLHEAGRKGELAELYHQGAQLVTVIMGSIAIVFIVFGHSLLLLWTGDASLAAKTAPLLALLAAGNLMNGLMWIPHHTQLAHGWTTLSVRVNATAVLLLVPATVWASITYGAAGAAWVWVCLNALYILLAAHLMFSRILQTEKRAWYIQDLAKPLLAAGAIVLLSSLVFPKGPGSLAQLLTLAVVSACAVVAAAFVADRVRRKLSSTLRPFLTHSG